MSHPTRSAPAPSPAVIRLDSHYKTWRETIVAPEVGGSEIPRISRMVDLRMAMQKEGRGLWRVQVHRMVPGGDAIVLDCIVERGFDPGAIDAWGRPVPGDIVVMSLLE